MGASLNFANCHLSRVHGEITCLYTWMGEERVMVLLPTYRRDATWFVVREPLAHLYDDPRHLLTKAIEACDVMGFGISKFTAAKIARVIHDGLPDLVRMPSSPPPEMSKGTYGSLILKADGQEIGGEEIRYEAAEVAEYERV